MKKDKTKIEVKTPLQVAEKSLRTLVKIRKKYSKSVHLTSGSKSKLLFVLDEQICVAEKMVATLERRRGVTWFEDLAKAAANVRG